MPPDGSPPTDPPTAPDTIWPYIGVGCLTLVVGFFGGGMISVLIGKVVDGVTGCRPAEGLPVCAWWRYVLIGGGIGAVLLPVMALLRLRQGRRSSGDSQATR